jgi:hypothetical protein
MDASKQERPRTGAFLTNYLYLFYRSNQLFEDIRLIHRQVGQHFPVKTDPFLAELMDKGRIGQPLRPNAGVDPGYPECAVFPFLQFPAYITVLKTLLQDVLGDGIYIFTFAVESLCLFQDALPASPGSNGVD